MKRKTEEILSSFKVTIDRLLEHCKSFDSGNDFAAIDIAVVLRTLLYTKYDDDGNATSFSFIDELKNINSNRYNINYISTCMEKPKTDNFIQGWSFGSSIHSSTIIIDSPIFGGLILKTIKNDSHSSFVADVKIWGDESIRPYKLISLDKWLQEEVFCDVKKNISLNRIEAIKFVANKDGGSHFDRKVPKRYEMFRHPETFKIYVNGKDVPFSRNPVYVTLRQIAWEVIESFKKENLI